MLLVGFALLWFRPVTSSCVLFGDVVNCVNVTQERYLYDVHRVILGERPTNYSVVQIRDSDFEVIDTIRCTKWCRERTLEITRCKVKSVAVKAFDDLHLLEALDLSYNRLESAEFATRFGRRLKLLNLAHNRLKSIQPEVFAQSTLDLSFNELTFLDLGYMCRHAREPFVHAASNHITAVYNGSRCDISLNLANNPLLEMEDMRVLEVNLSNTTNDFVKVMHGFRAKVRNASNNLFGYLHDVSNDVYSQKIYLSHCSITDFSETVFGGNSLEVVDLSRNSLEHLKLPRFESASIDLLDMSHSNLSSVDDLFRGLRCNTLKLGDSRITRVTSASFRGIQDLSNLDLSSNELRLENASFSNCPALTNLDLSNGRLVYAHPLAFFGLIFLEDLNLENTSLTVLESGLFQPLVKLKRLNLKFNPLTSVALTNVGHVSAAVLKVTLSGNLEKNAFVHFHDLERLVFDDSVIGRIANGAFRNLWKLELLEFINTNVGTVESRALVGLLSLTHVDDVILKSWSALEPRAFQDLVSLTYLDLSGSPVTRNNLTDLDPDALSGLKNLEQLDLSYNPLKNISDFKFRSLRKLTTLKLEVCGLSRLSVDAFFGLARLRVLSMSLNELLDVVVGTFRHFPDLESLDLSRNRIEDLKVGVFSNLARLRNLDLARNSMSKLSKEVFAPLRRLEVLNLEGNHLKNIDYKSLLKNVVRLMQIGVNGNKWKCEDLAPMLESFRQRNVEYLTENPNYLGDNVEGIGCVDVCKYLLCLKDSHGIN
ncbi:protein artichoke-like [Cylas formicarius]|uniref:protein artichoke-like n=1 Tax=Cylas formicarius TaxID=197179 RepID=UPI002958DB1D|nr:protein artichoke-like [Cylas formicarius]